MQTEERKIIRSIVLPFLFVFLLWAIWAIEVIGDYNFGVLGIYPLRLSGLIGILTAPLIHADFSHLASNSVPLLVLGSALFYFYRDLALRIFVLIYLLTGAWVWLAARPAYHIGASGVVYGLAMFIFASGVIRKHSGLMAVALVVVFLYGSLVWGIFPEFFPEQNISWESHLLGLVAGLILAMYFRNEGPQRRRYEWELEEEMEEMEEEKRRIGEEERRRIGEEEKRRIGEEERGRNGDGEDMDEYWKTDITDEEIKKIRRIYRPRRYDDD
jgi:membrane associated rhomboid family serine protease